MGLRVSNIDNKQMERCPSGRWCNLGKIVWEQFHQGFESPPLLFLVSERREGGLPPTKSHATSGTF